MKMPFSRALPIGIDKAFLDKGRELIDADPAHLAKLFLRPFHFLFEDLN
jgi:hypothetical protein